jgi:predicted DCC family thiol-disulfide oxidoreductase YuxK
MSAYAKHILYDGQCAFCTNSAHRIERALRNRGWKIAPLQDESVKQRIRIAQTPNELAVISSEGRTLWGVDGLLHLAGQVWWARPIAWLGKIGWMRRLMRRGYAFVAARRACVSRACRVK